MSTTSSSAWFLATSFAFYVTRMVVLSTEKPKVNCCALADTPAPHSIDVNVKKKWKHRSSRRTLLHIRAHFPLKFSYHRKTFCPSFSFCLFSICDLIAPTLCAHHLLLRDRVRKAFIWKRKFAENNYRRRPSGLDSFLFPSSVTLSRFSLLNEWMNSISFRCVHLGAPRQKKTDSGIRVYWEKRDSFSELKVLSGRKNSLINLIEGLVISSSARMLRWMHGAKRSCPSGPRFFSVPKRRPFGRRASPHTSKSTLF